LRPANETILTNLKKIEQELTILHPAI